MKKMTKNGVWGVACCLGLVVGLFVVVGAVTPVKAAIFSIDTVDGDWANALPVAAVTVANSGPGGGLSTARWGDTTGQQSGYDFLSAATPLNANSDGTPFALGAFTHHNFPVFPPSLDSIDLGLTVEDIGIFSVTTAFNIAHNETSNDPGPPESNDIVTILNPVVNTPFSYLGDDYFFNLLGFSEDGGGTISTVFNTEEDARNVATLYATITRERVSVPEPATMLLMGIGMAGLMGSRIRNTGKKQ